MPQLPWLSWGCTGHPPHVPSLQGPHQVTIWDCTTPEPLPSFIPKVQNGPGPSSPSTRQPDVRLGETLSVPSSPGSRVESCFPAHSCQGRLAKDAEQGRQVRAGHRRMLGLAQKQLAEDGC